MPYFNNCQYGINAQSNSNVRIKSSTYLTNITQAAIDSDNGAIISVFGTTGGTGFTGDITGPALYISACNAGLNIRNTYLNATNCIILNTNYGILSKQSTFSVRNSTISKSNSEVNTIGVQAADGSVGIVVGISITGYPSPTGNTAPTGGSLLSSINDSTLFVPDSTLSNFVNVSQGYSPGSVVIGVPFRLVSGAGSQTIPGDQFPFDY